MTEHVSEIPAKFQSNRWRERNVQNKGERGERQRERGQFIPLHIHWRNEGAGRKTATESSKDLGIRNAPILPPEAALWHIPRAEVGVGRRLRSWEVARRLGQEIKDPNGKGREERIRLANVMC